MSAENEYNVRILAGQQYSEAAQLRDEVVVKVIMNGGTGTWSFQEYREQRGEDSPTWRDVYVDDAQVTFTPGSGRVCGVSPAKPVGGRCPVRIKTSVAQTADINVTLITRKFL